MRAITVHNPYAWAIAYAAKSPENRGNPIGDEHIGTDIGIHAGRIHLPHGAQDPRIITAARKAARTGRARTVAGILAGTDLTFGAVIAVARLTDCHQARRRLGRLCCQPWGEEFHGVRQRPAYHLVLDDAQPLPIPVPCRGMQAVPWQMPPDVTAAVQAQLSAHR